MLEYQCKQFRKETSGTFNVLSSFHPFLPCSYLLGTWPTQLLQHLVLAGEDNFQHPPPPPPPPPHMGYDPKGLENFPSFSPKFNCSKDTVNSGTWHNCLSLDLMDFKINLMRLQPPSPLYFLVTAFAARLFWLIAACSSFPQRHLHSGTPYNYMGRESLSCDFVDSCRCLAFHWTWLERTARFR